MNSTEKQIKNEATARLQNVGFSIAEANKLFSIQKKLRRWGEALCNGEIFIDEFTGSACRYFSRDYYGNRHDAKGRESFVIPNVEKISLRQTQAIIDACNSRQDRHPINGDYLLAYHQTDPRGCALFIVPRNELMGSENRILPIDEYYTRGIAICY